MLVWKIWYWINKYSPNWYFSQLHPFWNLWWSLQFDWLSWVPLIHKLHHILVLIVSFPSQRESFTKTQAIRFQGLFKVTKYKIKFLEFCATVYTKNGEISNYCENYCSWQIPDRERIQMLNDSQERFLKLEANSWGKSLTTLATRKRQVTKLVSHDLK